MADNSTIKIKLQITNIDEIRQQIKGLSNIGLGSIPGAGSGGSSGGGNFGTFNRNPGSVNVGVGTFTSGNLGLDVALFSLEKFKAGIFALINPLKEASEAAYKFEASIVATVGTLQATTRIVDARGIQVDPGTQLREQFRIATGLEKAGRGSLAPIGVGGAEQSLLTNTFIQAQTTKTGVAVSEQDLKTTLPRLVAAIKVLAPNLGETREAKELRDIVLNQRVGQITAGPGIRALAPDLAKARTAAEFEEATRPLEAYITALKEGNTPLAERLKLEGEFHIVQQDAGEAFNQALLPGLKAIETVLEDPAISTGLQTLAGNIGSFVTQVLQEAARLTRSPLGEGSVPTGGIEAGINQNLKANGIKGTITIPNAEPTLFDFINAVPHALDDFNPFNAITPSIPDIGGAFANLAKARGLQQKPGGALKPEPTPESKFATLLSGLGIDPEKFNKTTSSDLANLANDPNVQIFQGQQLKSGIAGTGLDSETANERSLGALRLIAGGQEKNQQIGDRNFASNLPGQIAKTIFDIKSLNSQISTQRAIVDNRREAIANEKDPLKKGILTGELNTELDKLKEKLKSFGDALKEAEAQPLKIAKSFADLAITIQQLNHLPIRQAIQTGAADDAKNAAIRDRNNFNAEGPLRNLQRQSAFVSAAQKFGEAGGVGFQGGPSGFAGVAASEAAAKGLQQFKDSLNAATKAVNDFADGFEERQDSRDTDVFNAQKALDAANNGPSGDTGEEQDQHQRDIRAAQRALDKARQANINGFNNDDKEQTKLQGNLPSFFQNFLNSNLAGAQLAKEGTTVAQGADVDAEGLRGKNRALATAALDQLELSAKQAAESVGLLNQQLAQLQALGLTPASKAAANAQDSADNDNTDTGLAGGILQQQKDLNKLYGPKGKGSINRPFKPDSSTPRVDAMDLILNSKFKSGGGLSIDDGDAPGSQPPTSDTILDRYNNALHGPIPIDSANRFDPKKPTMNPFEGFNIDDLAKYNRFNTDFDYGDQGQSRADYSKMLDKLNNGAGKENPGPAITKGLGDVFNTWKSAFSKTNPISDAQNFIKDAGQEWNKAQEEQRAQERGWDKALNGPARDLMDLQKAVAAPSTGQFLGPQYAGPIETLSGQQERASIAAGLFAGVSGAGFEGTNGKTTLKGATIAADLTGGLADSNIKNFKQSIKTFAGISDFDSIFGKEKNDSSYSKPLTKNETADAFYDSLNRHFN